MSLARNNRKTRLSSFFQVLIQRTGERRFIALGAVNKDYDLHKMPGWYNGTVGYHVDDGKIFDSRCPEMGREIEGRVTLTAGHVLTKMFTEVSSHYNLCEVSPRSKTSSPLNLSTRFLMEKARVQKHDKSL